MEAAGVHWWLNFASMAGIAVLAVPTWSLNIRKKRLQAVRDALAQEPETFRDSVRSILADKRNREVSDWRRIDEVCLLVGYLLQRIDGKWDVASLTLVTPLGELETLRLLKKLLHKRLIALSE